MKTNLKLTKITISKLDNLNLRPLQNDELQNLKGGGEVPSFTSTLQPTTNPTDTSGPSGTTSTGGVDIITIGGGWNDTSSYTSCIVSEGGTCMTKLS
ncbi:hypothetical protein [uncultured Flavobacterium sp.]|uniref:hypothetical protein n=1 Tax=uncultured Flavobacterium sp. TaxID=165435 RepID=UPI003081BAB4